MIRSILTVLAAGMMFAGCMTQQMNSTPFYEGHDVTYTGKAEDRVNLWPLAYWREPVAEPTGSDLITTVDCHSKYSVS